MICIIFIEQIIDTEVKKEVCRRNFLRCGRYCSLVDNPRDGLSLYNVDSHVARPCYLNLWVDPGVWEIK